MRSAARTLLAAVAALVLAACAGSAADVRPVGSASASSYDGVELTEPYTMPEAVLTDSNGAKFDLRTGSDKPVLIVFFGYTNCPDICKTTMADLASALNRVSPETRAKVQVLLISVDPDRDTPEVLKDYLARFDPTFIGLTAPLEQVRSIATTMGVVVEGTTKSGNGYEVTHSTQVIGFDAARKGRLVWTQGTSIGSFKNDFEKFAAAQG
ncbi:SCO family protein [Micropruina sp.]|uniref:SCO family protein n=1 Tax=Micropruina sp. TaxID=2737536 RepID=UPI0039E5ECEA